jgi:hypothetical protein
MAAKRLQCGANACTAIPVVDGIGSPAKRRVPIAKAKRRRDAAQPCADGEDLGTGHGLHGYMGERQKLIGVPAHRAGNVDEQQRPPYHFMPPAQMRGWKVALGTNDLPERPAEVDRALAVDAKMPERAAAGQGIG